MKAHQAAYPVVTQCRVLGVSTSGYYAWLKRPPSVHSQCDAVLIERIRVVHTRSRGTYGIPRIHAELRTYGVPISRKRVARLMRMVGLCGVSRRKGFKTTVRDRNDHPAHDLVARRFTAEAPDQLWVADITYVPTRAGFLFLAVVLDVCTRRIVGWAMAGHLRTELTLGALNHALLRRRVAPGLIFHSDRGVECSAYIFRARLAALDIIQSMKRPREIGDNAFIESFFHSMKADAVHGHCFPDDHALLTAISQYIRRYNRSRLHAPLGYRSPIDYERCTA